MNVDKKKYLTSQRAQQQEAGVIVEQELRVIPVPMCVGRTLFSLISRRGICACYTMERKRQRETKCGPLAFVIICQFSLRQLPLSSLFDLT